MCYKTLIGQRIIYLVSELSNKAKSRILESTKAWETSPMLVFLIKNYSLGSSTLLNNTSGIISNPSINGFSSTSIII
jgi:hypothetical protein